MLITFILLDKYLEAAANKGRASAAISKLLEAAASSRPDDTAARPLQGH